MDNSDTVRAIAAGDPDAPSRLLPLVYDQLRAMARRQMLRENRGHTLQPTALVHEVYLRLVDETRVDWKGRAHFLAVAAGQMRRVLIDHARSRKALKRGGEARRVTLDERLADSDSSPIDLLDLDEAMARLAELSPRQAQVVELRVFGGMTTTEAAHVLGISETTVKQDWRLARSWLAHELDSTPRDR